jgi:hypothetical protein
MPTPTPFKTRGGILAAVVLCFLALSAGGAWAVVAATKASGPAPPPAPTLGATPPPTTKQVWAAFSFTDRKRRIYFQCSLDGAPFKDCSSPIRYGPAVYIGRVRCKGQPKSLKGRRVKYCQGTVNSQRPALTAGGHKFAVRAVLHNTQGPPAIYSWTILGSAAAAQPAPVSTPAPVATTPTPPASSPPSGSGDAPVGQSATFTISGNPEGLLFPGAPARRLPLALTNPNTVPIYVTGLTVSAASENPECPVEENLLITQSDVSALTPVLVPAGASVILPAQGVTAPTVQLSDLKTVNQNGCKGSTFILRYSGSAHS